MQDVRIAKDRVINRIDQREFLARKIGLTDAVLKREPCPSDRRRAFAVLTDDGLAMQQKMWKVYAKSIADCFGIHLSSQESQLLQQAFQRMLAALSPE